MKNIIAGWKKITCGLNIIGSFLPQLAIRLLLAWEFWGAGVNKFNGENWFGGVQDQFPIPFSFIPVAISWFLATWTELLGSLALVAGLGTRFFAFCMLILDLVAWYAIHADNGYNVCDNGYQLPLMYMVLLLPLIFSGAGKLSVDYWLARKFK